MSNYKRSTVTWACDSCKKLNHPECNFCEFCGARKDNTPPVLKLWNELMAKFKPAAGKTVVPPARAAAPVRSGNSTLNVPNAPAAAQVVCPSCGHPGKAGQAFCARCGTSMKNVQPAPQVQRAPRTQRPPQAQPIPQVQRTAQTAPAMPVQAVPQAKPTPQVQPAAPAKPAPQVQPVPQEQPAPQAKPAPQAETKPCPACGFANPLNEFFCRNCGTLL